MAKSNNILVFLTPEVFNRVTNGLEAEIFKYPRWDIEPDSIIKWVAEGGIRGTARVVSVERNACIIVNYKQPQEQGEQS